MLLLVFIFVKFLSTQAVFTEDWASLDSRVNPAWYDQAKFGIFVHWGVFSVPSFRTEWFWSQWKLTNDSQVIKYIEKNYPPGFSYQEFAPKLTGEFLNATEWVQLFSNAGAKYVVITAKHHEGFALWPSKYSYSWNSMDVGPHRDVIGEVSKAVKAKGLRFGIYHSLYEWFNPMYLADKKDNTTLFVDNKVYPEMLELVNTYKPDLFWSDGDSEQTDEYWKSKKFIAWLFNESPVKDVVLTNDRWGTNIACHHGSYYTCKDRYNPGVLQPYKWENAMKTDWLSWGFRRNANINEYTTPKDLVTLLVQTVSCGGNFLLNVSPTKEGKIDALYQERLHQLGNWLNINGEAIYESNPYVPHQNDTLSGTTWFTQKNSTFYIIALDWPSNKEQVLQLEAVADKFKSSTTITMLGYDGTLEWTQNGNVVNISMPNKAFVRGDYAWVIKVPQ